MDKEVVVHIHNGILLSHKRNAFESVLMRWMNLESTIQSEVSQKRKINTVYEHIYMESRKMLLIKLFARQHKETNIENKFMDMGRGEKRVRCMERVAWKYIRYYM